MARNRCPLCNLKKGEEDPGWRCPDPFHDEAPETPRATAPGDDDRARRPSTMPPPPVKVAP